MRASQGEDVTVIGENTRQPDPVLYVNGIALGVLELKLDVHFRAGVLIIGVVASASLCCADVGPSGGTIGGAGEARDLDEGFDEYGEMLYRSCQLGTAVQN